MSTLEKLNFLVENNKMLEFVYEIHKKTWCDKGEDHQEMWCDGACKALKFLKLIKNCFEENVPMEQKRIFFIVRSLMHKDIFEKLFKNFVW